MPMIWWGLCKRRNDCSRIAPCAYRRQYWRRTAMPIRSIKMFSSGPLFFMGIAFAASAGFGQSQKQCAEMTKSKFPGVQFEITKAAWVPACPAPAGGPGKMGEGISLPAHCRVDGMIDRRAGAGGDTYGLGFAVSLPENWNGRFLQHGGGGLNGSVSEPMGREGAAADANPGSRLGDSKPEHILFARRQADLLSRRQRSLVFR